MTADLDPRAPADVRVLVVGLGSMGKRRVRNMQRLGVTSIVGFDPREDRRAEAAERYGIPTVATLDEAFQQHPDAVVASTPPDRHVQVGRRALDESCSFFLEASVVDDGLEQLGRDTEAKGLVGAASCTMRFNPSVRTIKEVVDSGVIGKVLTVDHHSGQWLPDWHPWEDYRTFYVSRRETGACREIVPFELSWLTWIFGGLTNVSAMKAKLSDLDADIDDVYQLLFTLERGGLGHLTVDVLARDPIRRCLVIGTEGTIVWNWADHEVRVFRAGNVGGWTSYPEETGTVEPGYVNAEEPYVREMAAFLDAVTGRAPWPYTLLDDVRTLRILTAAEESAASRAQVALG